MATLRHTLQTEIFEALDEKLKVYAHVNKALKKKKPSFLCISVTGEQPSSVYVHQVKKIEKNTFKKKRTWPLTALKCVDCKSKMKYHLEFDLVFDDKVYKWSAVNAEERRIFIVYLWKETMNQPIREKPEFKDMPMDWVKDGVSTNEREEIVQDLNEVNEDYQVLTEREEADLASLMSSCEFAISNAEAFVEMLSRDLNILDGENVQSVLASEEQVTELMGQIATSLTEVEKVEEQLNYYDDILIHIRNTMQNMEHKNSLIDIANKNNLKLLSELEHLITSLELPPDCESALVDTDLTSAPGLKAAIRAAKALQRAMSAEIHPALLRLAAVQEQKKRMDKWKVKFSYSISRHLNNLFVHLGNDSGSSLKPTSGPEPQLSLPQHVTIHKELAVFAELMHWIKDMDTKAYNELKKVYVSTVGKLYERDIKLFLEDAKQTISGGAPLMMEGGDRKSTSGGNPTPLTAKNPGLLGVEREQWPAESDPMERQRFDTVLDTVLSQLEPVCLSEQNFCVQFFQLDILKSNKEVTAVSQFEGNKKIEKQINEDVRSMMAGIFSCIEPELLGFITHHERQDSIYCMYILVRLTQHVMSAQDAGSFLSKSYGSILVQVKRSYDKYMQIQLSSIQETKVNKKNKCGILPFVANFEEFARNCELIFKNTERKTDLHKWYVRLVSAMFEVINNIAADHPKTPAQVVKMENYHHLFSLLSQLKIGVLDEKRKEAKQKYSDALKAYVTQYFGRPLEKLNVFFDGVQAKVAQGIKESEISYQIAFSKQELRKVIKEYPSREVKKGLDHLYRLYGGQCKRSSYWSINQ
uniref:Exocyst complex component 1 n=1 Tax=Cacopsylla melanoneura TaxID=428564 RepID=A0A8D9BVJ3_9HEMI